MCWSCDDHVMSHTVVTVRLEAPEYSVIESEGEVEVCAELSGHLDIPVSVFFSILDSPDRDQGKLISHVISQLQCKCVVERDYFLE